MSVAESLLIGESPVIVQLRRTIERVAPAKIPVLIEGATGTGKELVAALLHQLSGRRGALVAFNVCAFGDAMFDDALFGHVRGSFTGAVSDAPGFLREAHGGTVFLDEIGGLSGLHQPKLLRAIETGVFRPIGSSRDSTSDFRLVAATNEGIEGLVTERRFRSDLAYRISGVVLTLPTVDERRSDIPLLVRHFARRPFVESAAIDVLLQHPWPGNVRELKQVVDAALVFGRGTLDARAVEQALLHRARPVPRYVGGSESAVPNESESADVLLTERRRLVALLEGAAWDTDAVAREIGVHRSTLYRRLKRLRVSIPPAMCVREDIADGLYRCCRHEVGLFARICANPRECVANASFARDQEEIVNSYITTL